VDNPVEKVLSVAEIGRHGLEPGVAFRITSLDQLSETRNAGFGT
jgi:hypothetical protein